MLILLSVIGGIVSYLAVGYACAWICYGITESFARFTGNRKLAFSKSDSQRTMVIWPVMVPLVCFATTLLLAKHVFGKVSWPNLSNLDGFFPGD